MQKSSGVFGLKFVVAGIALLSFIPVQSWALDEIYSPDLEYRELSFEYNGSRVFDRDSAKNNEQSHELVVEAGLTPYWTAETSLGLDKAAGEAVRIADAQVGSRFQFSEAGEYWMDSGVLLAYGFSLQGHQPDTLEAKLLLQKDIGKITSTANIGFEQEVGRSAASGGPGYVFLENTRYRYDSYFQPGVEMQSDLGKARDLRHFDQQEHYVGPAAYGQISDHWKYQAAYLFGVSDASADGAARLKLEYELYF